jgi:hypothetical protein
MLKLLNPSFEKYKKNHISIRSWSGLSRIYFYSNIYCFASPEVQVIFSTPLYVLSKLFTHSHFSDLDRSSFFLQLFGNIKIESVRMSILSIFVEMAKRGVLERKSLEEIVFPSGENIFQIFFQNFSILYKSSIIYSSFFFRLFISSYTKENGWRIDDNDYKYGNEVSQYLNKFQEGIIENVVQNNNNSLNSRKKFCSNIFCYSFGVFDSYSSMFAFKYYPFLFFNSLSLLCVNMFAKKISSNSDGYYVSSPFIVFSNSEKKTRKFDDVSSSVIKDPFIQSSLSIILSSLSVISSYAESNIGADVINNCFDCLFINLCYYYYYYYHYYYCYYYYFCYFNFVCVCCYLKY